MIGSRSLMLPLTGNCDFERTFVERSARAYKPRDASLKREVKGLGVGWCAIVGDSRGRNSRRMNLSKLRTVSPCLSRSLSSFPGETLGCREKVCQLCFSFVVIH